MRKIIIYTTPIAFIIGLFVLFLPSFLSSNIGKKYVIRSIEKQLNATVHIEKLSLGWNKLQEVDHLYLEKKGELLFRFDSLTIDTSFWNLLVRRSSLNSIKLVNPLLILQAKLPGQTISSKPVPSPKIRSQKKNTSWLTIGRNMLIENGTFRLQQSGSDIIRINKTHFAVNTSNNLFPLTINFEGKTQYKELFGSFHAKGVIEQKNEQMNLSPVKTIQIDGEANLHNFPVAGIDAFFGLIDPSMRNVLLEAFGDSLNLDLLFVSPKTEQNFSIQLRSPRMMISLLADYKEGFIHLRNPMKAIWTVKPALMRLLTPSFPLHLISETHIEMDLDHLNLLFKDMKFDTHSLSCKGEVNIQRGAFAFEKTKNSILLDKLDFSFTTNDFKNVMHFSFENTFRFSSFPQTKMQGTLDFEKHFTKKNLLKQLSQLDVNIRNFPTTILQEFRPNSYEIQKWIGSNFDLKANYLTKEHSPQLILSGSSPLLNLSTSHFICNDGVFLTDPTTFTYKIIQNQWKQFVQPIILEGNIQNLFIPIKDNAIQWTSTALKANFQTQNIQVSNTPYLGELQLPYLYAQIEGVPSDSLNFEGTSILNFPPKSWGASLLSQKIPIDANGKIKVAKSFGIAPFNLNLKGEKVQLTIDGTLESNAFILKKPIKTDLILEANRINPILAKQGNFPLLNTNTSLHLQINPGIFPFKKDTRSSLECKIIGSIDNLQMIDQQAHYPFSFENVDLDFTISESKKISSIQIDANTVEQNQPKGVMEVLIRNETGDPNPFNKTSRVKIHFDHLSTQIGDAFLHMNNTLPSMIGPWVDLYFDTRKETQGKIIAVDLKSPYLKINGSFNARDKLELQNTHNPLKIEWNVSEAGYAAYQEWKNHNRSQKKPEFFIKDQAKIKLNVSKLEFPLQSINDLVPRFDINFYPAVFDAQMHIDSLVFNKQKTVDEPELRHFNINLSKKSVSSPLIFEMQGNVHLQDTNKKGQIKGRGKVNNFLTSQGNINLDDLQASIHMKIQHLPTIFLDFLTSIQRPSSVPPSALLGDMVNASFDTELIKQNGHLNLEINATNCDAILDGAFTNKTFYLNQPLKAKMTISPKMNEILSQNAKIKISSIKNPIELYISEKGFSIPISEMSFKNTNLSFGILDFGQITCRNTGNASDVSNIFKVEGKQNLISLWFAPMEFSIRNGLMHVNRTEILYNRAYQIALWGDINVDHRYVNMILGLTAQSLRAALGISLDPNYVLQIPIKGSFGSVQLDKASATSKIALLIARKQVAPQAGIWGQVFGAISSLGDDQSDVPPAKPPFPWQKVVNMQELTTTNRDLKKLFKKKAKAYEQEVKNLRKIKQ